MPDRRRLRLAPGATAARNSTRRCAPIAAEGAASSSTCAATRAAASGWSQKLQAYGLQDHGRDTVDANLELGLPVDARHYTAAAQILPTSACERSGC